MLARSPKWFCLLFFTFSLVVLPQSRAQEHKTDNKVNIKQDQLVLKSPIVDLDKSKTDNFDFDPVKMNEFQLRVQQRQKEVVAQGFGYALLLQPFNYKYRLYKYVVEDDAAVHGDIILGNLRQVIRDSISNRDAGIKAGDPASAKVPGSDLPPPLIADAAFRWPNGRIPYEIKREDFNSSQILSITTGIQTLNDSTNLALTERVGKEKDYVKIIGSKKIAGSGKAEVGRKGGKQKLWLDISDDSTFGDSTVQHELLHTAGFHHEQTRNDRNKYISILWKNIEAGNEHNFDIDDVRTYGEYDYNSIMHYSKTAFGLDCQITDYAVNHFCKGCTIKKEKKFLDSLKPPKVPCSKITMRSKTSTDINRGSTLSTLDIAAVNAAYPSSTTTTTVNTLPPISDSRTFSLTVEKIKLVAGTKGESSALCGKYPDFIGEIIVGDVVELDTGKDQDGILMANDTSLSKMKKKDKEVGNTVTPNWKISVPVGPDTKELYLLLKVFDYDEGTACGGKNDIVDISPKRDQGYLRLIVNLKTGELQNLRPQPSTSIGSTIYYERANYSGQNIFNSTTGEFVSSTFSGLDDNDATQYQMEASVTIKGTIQ
jgi:hypothetical protein